MPNKAAGYDQLPSGFFAAAASQQQYNNTSQGAPYAQPTPPPYYQYSAGSGPPYGTTAHYAQTQNQSHTRGYPDSTPIAPMDSRKRPRTWHCDACDLSLDSDFALQAHVKTHISCTACSFQAAPRVVKGHYEATHGKFAGGGFKTVTVAIPGCPVQRFRICVGNHPDDIAQWIADRRKRFPRTQTTTHKEPQQKQQDKSQKKELESVKEETGLASLLGGYGSSSDEEGEEKDNDNNSIKVTKQPSDEIDNKPDSKLSQDTPIVNKKPCHSFMNRGSCHRGDQCPYSHEVTVLPPKPLRSIKSTKPPTLLQKLLVNDQRREATLTIQLLQYIYDSNFLEKEVPLDNVEE
jgi:hypothetical protein